MAGVLSIAASAGLLFLLYQSMDPRRIWEALRAADGTWVAISVGMIAPITVLRAIRFYWIAPVGALPGIAEALRLTLLSSAVNVFVPAKGGDLVKSFFVARRSDTSAGVAVALVVYERLCDLFALIFWCMLGWAIGRPDVPGVPATFWVTLGAIGVACAVLISSERASDLWHVLVTRVLPHGRLRRIQELADGWPDLLHVLRGRRRWIVLFSLVLWLTHLFQLWLFTVALSVPVPFLACLSLSAVALLAGQLPFTFAGLGTRDIALVVLLTNYMAPETAAAMGVLISTRNFLPPLFGAPLMSPYVSSVVADWKRRKQKDRLPL